MDRKVFDDGVGYYMVPQVMVQVYLAKIQKHHLMHLRTQLRNGMAHHSMCGIIYSELATLRDLPDHDIRQLSAQLFSEFKGTTSAIAFIFPQEGFASAAIRAAMTGVLSVLPHKLNAKAFSNVRDAVQWLKLSDPSILVNELVQEIEVTLEQTRTKLGSSRARERKSPS